MPMGHRLMQDNDPKHTSRHAAQFFAEKGINWWKTPPESPDLNPIENLWHELKEFIRREVKPRTKEELISGITKFWDTVDVAKCRKYIGHIHRVIPVVIEQKGQATGF
jgi:transposase